MQQPIINMDSARIDQLEAEITALNRKYVRIQSLLLLFLVIGIAVGTIGWSSSARKIITAHEINITDEDGNPRMTMKYTEDYGTHLSMYSPYMDPNTGRAYLTHLSIGIDPSETAPYIYLTNRQGNVIRMFYRPNSHPACEIGVPNGLKTILGTDDSMVAGVIVHDESAKQGAGIGVHPSGTRWFNLMRKDKVLWAAP